MVGVLRVHVDSSARAEEALCTLPQCRAAAAAQGWGAGSQQQRRQQQQQLPWETLTHALMECPAAAPVVDWALQLWEALVPDAQPPPRCAAVLFFFFFFSSRTEPVTAVLLLDRRDRWRPPPYAEAVWSALRVTLLGCLWHVRCRRQQWGAGEASAAACAYRAAAAVVDHLSEAIRREWLRASEDVRLMSVDVCSSWFRGRDYELSKEAFLRRWGLQGRLCAIREDGSLRVRLSYSSPVPVPGQPVL